jgi:hypothetical protein
MMWSLADLLRNLQDKVPNHKLLELVAVVIGKGNRKGNDEDSLLEYQGFGG